MFLVLGGVDGGVSNLSFVGDVCALVLLGLEVVSSREVRIGARVTSLKISTICSSWKSSDEACEAVIVALGSLLLRSH